MIKGMNKRRKRFVLSPFIIFMLLGSFNKSPATKMVTTLFVKQYSFYVLAHKDWPHILSKTQQNCGEVYCSLDISNLFPPLLQKVSEFKFSNSIDFYRCRYT